MSAQTCPPPPPANLILEGTFETCPVDPGTTEDHAINDNCAPPWQAGNGTPSVCDHIKNYLGISFDAFEGDQFACISSNSLGTGACYNNEAMFQTVPLCPGVRYQLTFSYYNITLRAGTLFVGLTNGLTNVSNLDDGEPCFSLPSGSDTLLAIAVPATLDTADILGWQTVNITFLATSQTNNQLVFWVYPDITDYEGFNAGLDAISLFCAETPLAPEIAVQGECPSYNFTGSTNTVPGVGVTSWCWDFGDGTTGTGQEVSHTYAAEGTYTVCLTIADNCGGCIDSVCQVVDCQPVFTCPCTGTAELNIDAGDVSADPNDNNIIPTSILQTAIPANTVNSSFSPNTLFNTCLAIAGNLLIDNNYDLAIIGGEIRMQPGARIIVASGAKLTLGFVNGGAGTEQGIHGCEQMWRSIEVQPGGELVANYSVIQDGEYAIDILSSPSNVATLTSYWNTFDRNHVGVRIKNGAFAVVNQPFSFVRNKFLGTSDQLIQFSNDITNWNIDFPYAGITLQNTAFFIGQENVANLENEFIGLRNGVLANASNLYVHYAKFLNIQGILAHDEGNPFFNNSLGIGIFANNCRKVLVKNATFDHAARAVHTKNSSIEFKNNVITNVDAGVFNVPGQFQKINIYNNDIFFRGYGIAVVNATTSTIVTIDRNDPIQTIIPSLIDRPIGVAIIGGPVASTGIKRIANNHINLLKPDGIGIYIKGSGNWAVQTNEVSLVVGSTGTGQGINLEESDFNYLRENSVNGALAVGIETFQSEGNKYCCNITDGQETGFRFWGTCTTVNNIRHNEIKNHTNGLACLSDTRIGDQEQTGNVWNGSYGFAAALHGGNVDDIQFSEFKVKPPQGTNLWPATIFSPAGQWFSSYPGIPLSCSADLAGCPPLAPPPGEPEPPRAPYEIEDTIAAGDLDNGGGYGLMAQFEGERSLYRAIRQGTVLNTANINMERFYAAASIGSIGKFDEAERRIEAMWRLHGTVIAELDSLETVIDGLVHQISRIDSLYGVASSFADSLQLQSDKAAYLVALQLPLTQSQNLVANALQTQQAQVAGIVTLNNSIAGADVLTTNRKTVNRIYLETLALGNTTTTASQQNDLLSVANQCFLSGGDAVFQARVFYNILVAPLEWNDDDLCATGLRSAGQDRTQHPIPGPYSASLIPNPATDKFTVQVQNLAPSAMIQVRILGINGALVREFTVQNGQMMEHNLLPGIYFCQLIVGETPIGTLKLVVIP